MWPPLDTSHCRYRLNSIEKTRLSVNIPNLQYNEAIRLSIMSIDSVKATTAVGKVGAWDWMDRVGTRVHCASLGLRLLVVPHFPQGWFSRRNTRGVLPIMAYTGRLRLKRVPFLGFRYMDFTSLK